MQTTKIGITGICLLLLFTSLQLSLAGTTGKIAGTVIEKETGTPLPGANLIIEGTTFGAAADLNGNYTILHIPPGVYNVRASVIGYKKIVASNVRVSIDQTTPVDFTLELEVIAGETVTVVAERPVVQKDVSTSVTAISSEEVVALPITTVNNVVGLQAGIQTSFQNGIEIRGGQQDEALFLVDGVTFRDPRNNRPITGIALSSIQEVSVERGGFNAEYGQVRSGVINVVTREGNRHAYHGSITFKASPPAARHFGISPFDRNSMWLRPYLDDAVCWTGTDNGAWDKYTQKQYPKFGGWNEVSEERLADKDPNNDLTPLGCQREFIWQHRKTPVTDEPDYNIDAGFGGPVPFLSKTLGDLRFFTSYRRERELLLVPLTRPDYLDYDWSLLLTSNISSSMKLTMSSQIGKIYTMSTNWEAANFESSRYIRTPGEIVSLFEERYYRLFGTGTYSLTDINHKIFAAKLIKTVSPKTFYEVSMEHVARKYFTNRPALRDTTKRYEILPGYFVDEAEFGFWWGGHLGRARDDSKISATTLKADLTSQVNFHNLVKTGVELVYNDLNMNYGFISSFSGADLEENFVRMHRFPIRGAVYLQDKMEMKEFIVNIGLRLDYTNSNTEWIDVGTYDESFLSSKYDATADYPAKKSEPKWTITPRLGISHPITVNSKLFFNYGHFKQLPIYQELFRLGRSANGNVLHFGDPDLVLSKTIAYELGYDHALFNDYLIQLSAFYRDISDQRNQTHYQSANGLVNYYQISNNSYEDIRGFECTVKKSRGRWVTGFANYTYQVNTSGHFGHEKVFQDPSRQRKYNESETDLYQERPIPTPYARTNLSFYLPPDFDKFTFWGINPLSGVNVNLLADWSSGWWDTYNPKNITSIRRNVQRKDWFDMRLRLNKTFSVKKLRFDVFMEVENLLNTKRLDLGGFYDFEDRDAYFASLHLPKSKAYDNIVGNDRIGEYRKEGVPYQPVEIYNVQFAMGDPGIIYYDRNNDRYLEYVNNAWVKVNQGRMDKILDDKAYIDMPNMTSFWFLNPRQIFFGIRVSFDLSH